MTWRLLTPGQRALLAQIAREGSLRAVRPWQMRTVRALLARKLLRPKDRLLDGRDHPGLWFLSAQALRIVPPHLTRRPEAAPSLGCGESEAAEP